MRVVLHNHTNLSYLLIFVHRNSDQYPVMKVRNSLVAMNPLHQMQIYCARVVLLHLILFHLALHLPPTVNLLPNVNLTGKKIYFARGAMPEKVVLL